MLDIEGADERLSAPTWAHPHAEQVLPELLVWGHA
jgi:hypothetical protein